MRKAHQYFANAVVISGAHRPTPPPAYKWLRYLTSSSLAANTRIAASWELPAVSDPRLVATYLKGSPPQHRQCGLRGA